MLFRSFNSLLVNNYVSTIIAIKDGNRHTPGSLAGNAPITAVANHIVNAVTYPARNPFHLINSLQGFISKGMCAAVITHGYSPPVLDPAKHDLDLIPLFIEI